MKNSIIDIRNMDCMDLMAEFPDKHFDLAIVDIEYGIGASKPSVKPNTVKQKNGSILSVVKPNYTQKDWDLKMSTPEYFFELERVSKKQIIFGGNYYGLPGGYLIWDKINGDTDQFDCEMAWLSWSKRTDIVYYMWSGMFQGIMCSRDPFKAKLQQGNKKLNEVRIHPTQKPVLLYKWLLHKYAKPGDKILDTHAGSCSLAIACHDYGFDLTASELDPDYYAAAMQRIKNHESQVKMF